MPEPCKQCGSLRDRHGLCACEVTRLNEHREEIVDAIIAPIATAADDAWLQRLANAKTIDDVNTASHSVLLRVDRLLANRETKRIDKMLRDAPIEGLALQVNLALLASTLKAKHVLSERAGCYARIKARIERDEPARAESLLKGLE